ncbi:MAG TPA: Ig-like domain repeat protein [Patescibacteria group bacterium]|nr:Ig-like domain repeat protein [Patescibacteria group bacterium]
MRPVVRRSSVLAACLLLAGLTLGVSPAAAISGTHPVVVALCNFNNQTVQPNPPSYFEHMFSDAGAGELGALDYWHDVSYGSFSVSGTVVKGWYTLPISRDTWAGYGRSQKWSSCAEAAEPFVNLNSFTDVIVVFPEATTTTTAGIDASVTTLTAASTTVGDAANFPTTPFLMSIDDGSLPNNGNAETVNVTGISGTTFTIVRGQGGTTAKAHAAGATIIVPGDLFGFGQRAVTLNGNNYTLGGVVGAHDIPLSVFTHEMGHGFNFNHSRALSNSTNDYNDCFDIMSAISCIYSFAGAGTTFGGSTFGGNAKGPGMNAIQLDLQGWIPGARETSFNNSSCTQQTYTMAALNHPAASGYQELRIPAGVVIAIPASEGSTATSDYYTVELRSRTGWDRGIPADAFVLHLEAAGRSYWVDQFGGQPVGHFGSMWAGDEHVDAANKAYVAVNSIDPSTFTGVITLGACKINASLTYNGDTDADFTDAATLAGDLLVQGSSAPVPGAPVTFTLGSQSCTGTTDAAGHASCTVVINQDPPGPGTVSAAYAGDAAYNSASTSASFTINQEATQVVYTGDLTQDYHDPFTASAVLTDPDSGTPIGGKTVTFTLGAADTCSAVTDGSGVASCSITPNQVPGTVNIVTDFAGDVDFLASSDTDSFVITREETTLTYTGPTVILQGASGVTLSAQLLEDGTTPPVPFGQAITLSIGGQSCTGFTDSAGNASCTLTFVGPLGPEPITADFAGDAYYLPSSDSADAIVFAFPSRGAFSLGDSTVAAADPSATLTWWSSSWSNINVLTGGPGPDSYKGFDGSVTTLPTTSPASSCGSTFVTRPGNSTPPTGDVPTYMGVLVTGAVSQSGSKISGTWSKIVVVRVDPGYGPNPGHDGTGTIVAVFCG